MLTTRRFSEFDTSVICHAVLILCLGSFLPVARYVLRLKVLALKGKRLKYSVKIMLTLILYRLILWRRDRIFDLNCKHSVLTVCCFLITNIIFILVQVFRDCCSFTSRKLYIFLEALLCFFWYQFGRTHSKEKQQLVWDEIALLDYPQFKYEWLSINTAGKTVTTSNDHVNCLQTHLLDL